jgi:hypothetical protein
MPCLEVLEVLDSDPQGFAFQEYVGKLRKALIDVDL